MKFIISENQYKLYLIENYDLTKEFLESREARVIVSIPNQKNPKDPNSCKVLRYATPEDQKLRLDPKNPTNYSKAEEYTTFCYIKGDLENKIKIFDKGLGKQQIDKETQDKKNTLQVSKQTEIDAFDLLRDFTTTMSQKLNSGGYSSTEYCVNPCYVSKNGQFWKFLDEIKNSNQGIDETKPKYVSDGLIKKYACINKNVLSSYQDFIKGCDSNAFPILSKEFNCNSIDDCRKKMDFYLKNFYIQKEKNLSELIVEYRHGILTTLSVVSSLIPLAGPLLALTFDLADAYIYYKEEEYYSAGLNLIFALIPVGQLASYGIVKTTTLMKGIQEASVLAKEGKLTEEILPKIFTQQDLKSLKSLAKQTPELTSKMFKETAEKMTLELFEKTPTEKILRTLNDEVGSKPVRDLVGQGIMFGGAFLTWNELSKKYQIADSTTKEKIKQETQSQIAQNITKNIVKEKSPEKQKEALQKLEEFEKELEKIEEGSKKVAIVTYDNGYSVDANEIPW